MEGVWWEANMGLATRQDIERRIHEIDERLRNLDAAEMTEGVLFYAPDSAEVAQLYQQRERLLQELQGLPDRAA